MTEHDIKQLIDRYIAGNATPTEAAQLESWYNRHAQDHPHIAYPDNLPERMAQGLPPILAAPQYRPERPRATRRLYKLLPYVAAVLLVVSAIGYFAMDGHWPMFGDRKLAATDILPGGNKATLTLADGRVIDLSSEQEGIIVGAEDITYQDGSTLAAVIPSAAEESQPNSAETHSTPLRSAQGDASVMLALTTPTGGTYQITLPDGSKVWLNSASTLKYPSRFSGESRNVILEGEAYFEIRPQAGKGGTRGPVGANPEGANPEGLIGDNDHSPFSVQTANQVVNVLGTAFNVSAYPDDPETKTTLVEGKVKVTSGPQTGLTTNDLRLTTKILSPGQQATTRVRLPGQGAATTINDVDVTQYTSWKNGLFDFRDTPLDDVFKQLGRWYAIEVEPGQLPDVRIDAVLSRQNTLQQTLQYLEKATGLRFTWKGGRLMVH